MPTAATPTATASPATRLSGFCFRLRRGVDAIGRDGIRYRLVRESCFLGGFVCRSGGGTRGLLRLRCLLRLLLLSAGLALLLRGLGLHGLGLLLASLGLLALVLLPFGCLGLLALLLLLAGLRCLSRLLAPLLLVAALTIALALLLALLTLLRLALLGLWLFPALLRLLLAILRLASATLVATGLARRWSFFTLGYGGRGRRRNTPEPAQEA